MCKAADRGMRIESIRLLEKTGGKSGSFVAGSSCLASSGRQPRTAIRPADPRINASPLDRHGELQYACRSKLGLRRRTGNGSFTEKSYSRAPAPVAPSRRHWRGLLKPGSALAAWNKGAFDAKTTADAMKALG